MAKKKTPTTKQVVQPIVKEEGKPHNWEQLFEGGEMPTLKSVGYAQDPASGKYISYVITTKGENVLLIEAGEPDFRQVAEEATKMSFAEIFMGAE